MAITNVSGDIKSVLERIGGMCFKAESILNLCMDGFMKHKVDSIDEARKVSPTIRNEGNELRKLFSAKAVNEVCHIFKETLYILKADGDTTVTRNKLYHISQFVANFILI